MKQGTCSKGGGSEKNVANYVGIPETMSAFQESKQTIKVGKPIVLNCMR